MKMDALDCELVNILQDGIGITERPYLSVARQLGVDENDVVRRIARLREDGYLSRFGPMFDAEKMGGAITLCAMEVPADSLESVAATLNALPEVAHNYERDHALNMWFVVATDAPDRLLWVIEEVEAATGCTVFNLPKLDEYFIGLRLDAGAGS